MSGSCPTSPFPAKCLLRSRNRNLSSSSMSGKKYSRAFGVHLWELEATYPPMTRAQFDPIYAFALSQDGTYGTFTFTAHDRDTPQGVATGTPVVRNRQNLFTYSEQLDNAIWLKGNSSVSANTDNDPNGIATADRLIENSSNAVHSLSLSKTLTAEVYTFSIYAKAASRSKIELVDTTASKARGFDLSNGTTFANTLGVGNATSYAITDAGSGWYRCSITYTASASATSLRAYLNNGTTALAYTGDGSSYVILYGAQLEKHSGIGYYVTATSAAVNTESQSGNTLYVGGFTASTTGIMKAGDLLKINSSTKVYMVTADADSDASGIATLTIHPALISTPVDAETVTVNSVPFTVSLADDILESFTDQADVYTYAMKMVEAL